MSEIQHFSQQDIEILGEQTLYEGFSHLNKSNLNINFLLGTKWCRNPRITD